MSVALLRDPEAERRAKERAEAPTVKTEEQILREEAHAQRKHGKESAPSVNGSSGSGSSSQKRTNNPFHNIWRRKFRSLPEAKAVDLFADVIGDAFILSVATGLLLYEYWKAQQKPDINAQRLDDLDRQFEEMKRRGGELAEKEERQQRRFDTLEDALRELRDPKTKKPLLESLQTPPEPTAS